MFNSASCFESLFNSIQIGIEAAGKWVLFMAAVLNFAVRAMLCELTSVLVLFLVLVCCLSTAFPRALWLEW